MGQETNQSDVVATLDAGANDFAGIPYSREVLRHGSECNCAIQSNRYTYDSRGNITSETRTDASGNSLVTTYVYDALGQLVRVNDPHDTTASAFGTTWVFSYDRGGNITGKACHTFSTGSLGAALETIPYSYGDSNWKDKLTAYNGLAFTYDAIGNPLSDGVWNYEWEAGRRLKAMSAEGTALTFKYDHNGLRTQKVVQQDWYLVTTNYTLHGKLITHMTVDYTDWDEVAQKDVLHFFYDAQSRPAKVSFNGVIYTYLHNLQGDIVGIVDNNGMLVVEYKYDAWGKLLSTVGTKAATLGKLNPFRYRGNVYDEETSMYYLQARYYNPEICRFINTDCVILFDGSSTNDCNLFVYCRNNPVTYADTNGYFINMIAGAISGAVVGGINAFVNNGNVWAGVGIGAATGAVAGLAVDVAVATGGVGMFVVAGVVGGASNVINSWSMAVINNEEQTFGEYVIDFVLGMGFNLLSLGVAGGSFAKQNVKTVGQMLTKMAESFKKTIFSGTIFKKLSHVTVQKFIKKVTIKTISRMTKNILTESTIAGIISGAAALWSSMWKVIFE